MWFQASLLLAALFHLEPTNGTEMPDALTLDESTNQLHDKQKSSTPHHELTNGCVDSNPFELSDEQVLQIIDEDECTNGYYTKCPVDGPLHHIQDKPTGIQYDPDRALHSLPDSLIVKESSIPKAGLGVFTIKEIPARTVFGPYRGVEVMDIEGDEESDYIWTIDDRNGKELYLIDAQDKTSSNWMRYVNCPLSESDENLVAFQYREDIYYRTSRPILPGEELLVWYGHEYANILAFERGD